MALAPWLCGVFGSFAACTVVSEASRAHPALLIVLSRVCVEIVHRVTVQWPQEKHDRSYFIVLVVFIFQGNAAFISVRFVVLSHSLLYLSYSFRVFSSYFCLFLSSCLFFPSTLHLKSHIIPISSSLLLLFSSQPCLVHLFFFFGFSILLFSWVPGVLNFFAWFSSLVSLLSSLLVVCRRFAEDAKEQVWAETPHLRQRIANFTVQAIAGNSSGESRPAVYRRQLSDFLACVFSSSML